jgi:hypothetical protein
MERQLFCPLVKLYYVSELIPIFFSLTHPSKSDDDDDTSDARAINKVV